MSSLPSAKLQQNIFSVIMRTDQRFWSNPFSLQSNSENQKMVISIFVIPWSLLITQQAGPKFQLKRHLKLFLYDFDCQKTILAPQESSKQVTYSLFSIGTQKESWKQWFKAASSLFWVLKTYWFSCPDCNSSLNIHAGCYPFFCAWFFPRHQQCRAVFPDSLWFYILSNLEVSWQGVVLSQSVRQSLILCQHGANMQQYLYVLQMPPAAISHLYSPRSE